MLLVLGIILISTVRYSDQWSILPTSNEAPLANNSSFQLNDTNVVEDAKLAVPQLIRKYGYNAEVHYVTTEDGYILELHRISGGPKSPPRKGKKVCFLVHGLSITSMSFLISGPNHALGFRLADEEFDVWMINNRGNFYSTGHVVYDAFGSRENRSNYWSFSMNEIGIYDLPASIDYILSETGETKVNYIGHSHGATVYFIMTSEKPEYNAKIELMHALAPPVFLRNISLRSVRAMASLATSLRRMKSLIGMNYIDSMNIKQKMFRHLAGNNLATYMGESDQTNNILMSILVGYFEKRASFAQFLHYWQLIKTGRFQNYDYGWVENYLLYNKTSAPDYNLKNAIAPVAIYYGRTDMFTVVKDVEQLIAELPNVVKEYLVPAEKFNHIDFIFGNNAPAQLYDEIVKTIKSI